MLPRQVVQPENFVGPQSKCSLPRAIKDVRPESFWLDESDRHYSESGVKSTSIFQLRPIAFFLCQLVEIRNAENSL